MRAREVESVDPQFEVRKEIFLFGIFSQVPAHTAPETPNARLP